MNKIPRLLSAPPLGAGRPASAGAPDPVAPGVRMVACPASPSGLQRYRLPLWRMFSRPK
jgi:hypothetical protein